jgi:hypothetical protein
LSVLVVVAIISTFSACTGMAMLSRTKPIKTINGVLKKLVRILASPLINHMGCKFILLDHCSQTFQGLSDDPRDPA